MTDDIFHLSSSNIHFIHASTFVVAKDVPLFVSASALGLCPGGTGAAILCSVFTNSAPVIGTTPSTLIHQPLAAVLSTTLFFDGTRSRESINKTYVITPLSHRCPYSVLFLSCPIPILSRPYLVPSISRPISAHHYYFVGPPSAYFDFSDNKIGKARNFGDRAGMGGQREVPIDTLGYLRISLKSFC